MSQFCLLQPNHFQYKKGQIVDDCRVEDSVAVTQNLFNYNNVNCSKKNILQNYPFLGVIPSGPATGSWPCRNQESCNYFEKSNPIIPEHIRKIDLLSLPPN
tara:strand:- start:182 stop:484 length:303 start_codon:yes stop_codon:yes gene_type:complete